MRIVERLLSELLYSLYYFTTCILVTKIQQFIPLSKKKLLFLLSLTRFFFIFFGEKRNKYE